MTLDVDIYKYLKKFNQIHSKELHLFGSRRECRKALDELTSKKLIKRVPDLRDMRCYIYVIR